MFKIKGLYAALPTPFREDGSLNEKALEKLLEKGISDGLEGFYLSGSTGESYMMTDEERMELFRQAAAIMHGRAQLIAHVGSFSLGQALAMAECAASVGVNAVSSVPPFYFPFRKEELCQYYRELHRSTGLPVLVYNIPAMSGIKFSTEDLLSLLSEEGIAGVKQTTMDLFQTETLVRKSGGKAIINGHDEIFLPALSVGVRATIGSTVILMPDIFRQVEQKYLAGENEAARKAQSRINDMIESLLKVGIFKGVKAVLALQGIDCGRCREPFAPLTKDEMQIMKDALERLEGAAHTIKI